jgi:hypothetical protein
MELAAERYPTNAENQEFGLHRNRRRKDPSFFQFSALGQGLPASWLLWVNIMVMMPSSFSTLRPSSKNLPHHPFIFSLGSPVFPSVTFRVATVRLFVHKSADETVGVERSPRFASARRKIIGQFPVLDVVVVRAGRSRSRPQFCSQWKAWKQPSRFKSIREGLPFVALCTGSSSAANPLEGVQESGTGPTPRRNWGLRKSSPRRPFEREIMSPKSCPNTCVLWGIHRVCLLL